MKIYTSYHTCPTIKMIQGGIPHKNKAIHRISLCPDLYRKAERNQMRFPLERGRGGDEPPLPLVSKGFFYFSKVWALFFFGTPPCPEV
jgi:hypothetical protein